MMVFGILFILLKCQIETEAGSVGEQPVRDRFDLYRLQRERAVFLDSLSL